MILTGETLAQALRVPVDSVRLIDPRGKTIRKLSADETVTLLSKGGYEVGGSPNRVKYLRQMAERRLFAVPARVSPTEWYEASDFWAGRSVLRFWRNQRTGIGRLLEAA